MKTQFFHCDICKNEIKGKIAVFLFNEIALTSNFEQVPVNKQADFCENCAEKIIKAIDEIDKDEIDKKVGIIETIEEIKNQPENENNTILHPGKES